MIYISFQSLILLILIVSSKSRVISICNLDCLYSLVAAFFVILHIVDIRVTGVCQKHPVSNIFPQF